MLNKDFVALARIHSVYRFALRIYEGEYLAGFEDRCPEYDGPNTAMSVEQARWLFQFLKPTFFMVNAMSAEEHTEEEFINFLDGSECKSAFKLKNSRF